MKKSKLMIPTDTHAEKTWPNLFRALSVREGQAAGDRQGTVITLSSDGDGYKATVNMYGFGKQFTVAFYELQHLLGVIEKAFTDPLTLLSPLRRWKEKKEENKS